MRLMFDARWLRAQAREQRTETRGPRPEARDPGALCVRFSTIYLYELMAHFAQK